MIVVTSSPGSAIFASAPCSRGSCENSRRRLHKPPPSAASRVSCWEVSWLLLSKVSSSETSPETSPTSASNSPSSSLHGGEEMDAALSKSPSSRARSLPHLGRRARLRRIVAVMQAMGLREHQNDHVAKSGRGSYRAPLEDTGME